MAGMHVRRWIPVSALLALSAGCLSLPPLDLDEVRRAYDAVPVEMGREAGLIEPEESAEPDPFARTVKEIDLDTVVRYALDHNPRIRAARLRALASEARARAAGYLPDPRLTWNFALEEIQTRNGPVEHVLSLTQQFPYWEKLSAERNAARWLSEAEREALLSVELSVVRDVQKVYFAIFLTEREIEINERTQGILRRFVRVAQRKVAAGKGGQPDILLAETELLRLENERVDLDQRLQTQKAYLNTLLDRKPGAYLPRVGGPRPVFEAEVDELIEWALEKLPDIRRVKHLVERNREVLRGARLRYIPDITLGLSYSVVGRSPIEAGAVKSGRDAITGILGLNLPLWFTKYRAEIEAARNELISTQAALRDVETFAVYRIVELHVRVETALRHIELFRDAILPKARQVLEVLERAYAAGRTDFLKLLDAERALERFELEYQRALADFEMRLAELTRAVGKPLREEKGR